ncbi:hypothetical protein KJ616_00825 [Patescibacteria group bacterium]|nr:hypothetical protein [Patescibacteria group bacterium]
MAIPKFLKTFLTGPSPSPRSNTGSFGEKRAPEEEITKRPSGGKGLFGGKPFLRRPDFRRVLKKAPERLPGVVGGFKEKERVALEEGLFPKKEFGEYITPYEVNRRLRNLKREMIRERNISRKLEKRKELQYLEALRGKPEENEK